MPSADTDADSPVQIEWGLEGEVCGLQPRFCCYVVIPPFFIRAQAMSGLSLSLSLYLFRVRQRSSAHTAQLKLKPRCEADRTLDSRD